MKIELLEDLYKQHILELHDAERQVRRMLNKVTKAVSTPELHQLFRQHNKETRKQIDRLDVILERLGAAQQTRKSKAMSGLLFEAKELLKVENPDRDLLDTALSLSQQKVEAFEIFSYGALVRLARLLNQQTDAQLLEQTLEEERRMEQKLAGLAEVLTAEAADTELHEATTR